jgi:hypothetical protein
VRSRWSSSCRQSSVQFRRSCIPLAGCCSASEQGQVWG